MNTLDIAANRKLKKYPLREIIMRILWGLVRPLFRYSPRPLFGWRCFLLKLFGAKIGKSVNIYNTAIIYMPWNLEIADWSSIGENAYIYNLGKIIIGAASTISARAYLCAGTHDYTDPAFPLLKQPIHIGDQVWVCTDAFINPNITIGDGAIIAARAVVTKNVDAWHIVGGNPATFIKQREIKNN